MSGRAILVVAEHEKNLQLLADFLEEQGYDPRAASTIGEIDRILQEELPIDMSLIDVTGFGQSIWDRCERLRTRGIPFFIISPKKSGRTEQRSLSEGARDTLTKPLDKGRLLKLVEIVLGK